MKSIQFISVTPENIDQTGVFCIKDRIAAGSRNKMDWFRQKCNEGLRMIIAADLNGKQLGFIEYTLSELAWRPINAINYLFIHCIMVYPNASRNRKIGSLLLKACEKDAEEKNKSGVCVMTSSGVWMAGEELFVKNGYCEVEKSGRFKLLVKKLNDNQPIPEFIDWERNLSKYKGWNLIYANQCPWHEKSVHGLKQYANKHGIDLKVTILRNPADVRKAPSGYGVFSLIKDGMLLEDHYLSKTRFENIIREQSKKNSLIPRR